MERNDHKIFLRKCKWKDQKVNLHRCQKMKHVRSKSTAVVISLSGVSSIQLMSRIKFTNCHENRKEKINWKITEQTHSTTQWIIRKKKKGKRDSGGSIIMTNYMKLRTKFHLTRQFPIKSSENKQTGLA